MQMVAIKFQLSVKLFLKMVYTLLDKETKLCCYAGQGVQLFTIKIKQES